MTERGTLALVKIRWRRESAFRAVATLGIFLGIFESISVRSCGLMDHRGVRCIFLYACVCFEK